jgi:hypothetical protein
MLQVGTTGIEEEEEEEKEDKNLTMYVHVYSVRY